MDWPILHPCLLRHNEALIRNWMKTFILSFAPTEEKLPWTPEERSYNNLALLCGAASSQKNIKALPRASSDEHKITSLRCPAAVVMGDLAHTKPFFCLRLWKICTHFFLTASQGKCENNEFLRATRETKDIHLMSLALFLIPTNVECSVQRSTLHPEAPQSFFTVTGHVTNCAPSELLVKFPSGCLAAVNYFLTWNTQPTALVPEGHERMPNKQFCSPRLPICLTNPDDTQQTIIFFKMHLWH